MRILVTGGAGFLGSHLVERLLEGGHEVIVLDNFFTGTRKNLRGLRTAHLEVMRHDVCEPFHVECDQIYHLACPASPVHYSRNPARTIKTAVQGTLNVLECARDASARVLITSTSEVYGDPLVHPQVETYWGNANPIGPRSCYDEGKRCAEALAVAYARQYKVDTRITRLFNTYGPRMHPNDGRVVSNFIVQALRGEALTIYGEGQQTRSFCYVDDTVAALQRMMALEYDPGPVNIGNPAEVTVRELAERVIQLTGGKTDILNKPLPQDDPVKRKPSIEKALGLGVILVEERLIPLDRGLRLTIDYFVNETVVRPSPVRRVQV